MATPPKTPQQLINEGQALVRSIALKVHRSIPVRVDLDDLISYGQVGLAEAAREFKADEGAQFTTFAYYRVRGAIYDGLSQMSWLSRAQYRRLQYEQRASAALKESHESQSGGPAERDDRSWLQNTTEKLAVVYLSTKGDDSSPGAVDTWEDPAAPPPAAAAARELGGRLHQLVDRLPEAEGRLIRAIYFEDYTLQEASARLGISKSWGSRLHARSLEQLARWLRQMGAGD